MFAGKATLTIETEIEPVSKSGRVQLLILTFFWRLFMDNEHNDSSVEIIDSVGHDIEVFLCRCPSKTGPAIEPTDR